MTATASITELQTQQSAMLPAAAPLEARTNTAVVPGFNSAQGWELAQRIGKAFSQADLVPQQYRGNLANCIVALEMANRMGASPLMVMQNLYIVHGNPGWSSKFLIACFNQSGKFSALRYEFDRDKTSGKATGCRAWAIEKHTNERLVGATVSVEMAREEGWSTKTGSKWKTMPEQMLMYRAAAFFVRTYAPEISMGLSTVEELADGAIIEAPAGTVRLADLQQPPANAPDATMTYAQVADLINQATDADSLDMARGFITAVADEQQQAELHTLAAKKLKDLPKA